MVYVRSRLGYRVVVINYVLNEHSRLQGWIGHYGEMDLSQLFGDGGVRVIRHSWGYSAAEAFQTVVRNLAHTPIYLGGIFKVWQNAKKPDFETMTFFRGFHPPSRPEELVTTDVKDLGSIAAKMDFSARIVTEIPWFPPPLYESRSRAESRCVYLNTCMEANAKATKLFQHTSAYDWNLENDPEATEVCKLQLRTSFNDKGKYDSRGYHLSFPEP